MNYEFVSDFKSNRHLNAELTQLIKRSHFRSTLDDWMLKGNSDKNYQYFGLLDIKGVLVAAVGLLRTNIFFKGKKYSAIQLGNVFFREINNFSLFEKKHIEHYLLQKVVSKFDTIVDLIYYYHDEDTLPLLHDFGLVKFQEHIFSLELKDEIRPTAVVKKVNLDNNTEFEELMEDIKHSSQVSRSTFDTASDSVIKIYNILKYYRRNVYKIPSLGATAVFEIRKDVFKFIALFSKRDIDINEIIKVGIPTGITKVEFGFTPCEDLQGLQVVPKEETSFNERELSSSQLYLKAISVDMEAAEVLFPILSRQK